MKKNKLVMGFLLLLLLVLILSPFISVLIGLVGMVIFSPIVWVILILLYFITKKMRS